MRTGGWWLGRTILWHLLLMVITKGRRRPTLLGVNWLGQGWLAGRYLIICWSAVFWRPLCRAVICGRWIIWRIVGWWIAFWMRLLRLPRKIRWLCGMRFLGSGMNCRLLRTRMMSRWIFADCAGGLILQRRRLVGETRLGN